MAHPIYDIILALLISSIIALLLVYHSISSPNYLRPIYEHIEVVGWSVGHLSRRELGGVSWYDDELADFDNPTSLYSISVLLWNGKQSRRRPPYI